MNFASFPYVLFLITVVCIYFGMSKKYRHLFLLFSSYLFYAFFGFGFLALMIITTAITFTTSYFCYYSDKPSNRKLFFYLGLGLDLLIFILFKYIHIIDIDIMNWPNWSIQKLLIPIGISFYTFKTVGYCIDIYKRKYAPESSFVYYALSVSFFPQLIAGPIEKSVVIAFQLKKNVAFNKQHIIDGGKHILWGMFKKIVIADSLAEIINPVLENIYSYNGLDFVIIFLAFPYQIYADFSGYSDIAIGSAKCFGITLPANFDKPFFSKNLSDFWRRWHITLYKWLKEYIYDLLLKGNQKQTAISNALKIGIVFLLVGLWHGATLNYFMYVLTAYLWLMVDYLTRNFRIDLLNRISVDPNSFGIKILNYVFILFMFSTFSVFLKTDSLESSIYIFEHINLCHLYHFKVINIMYIVLYIVVFEGLQYLQITPSGNCYDKIKYFYFGLFITLFMLFSILLINSRPEVVFQYFQF